MVLEKWWSHSDGTHGGNRVVDSGKPSRVPSGLEENWLIQEFVTDHFGGEPVIYKGRLYVAAVNLKSNVGMVCCIDLDSSQFVWRHEKVGINPNGPAAVNENYVVLGGVAFKRDTGKLHFDVWPKIKDGEYDFYPVVLREHSMLLAVGDGGRCYGECDWVLVDLAKKSFRQLDVPPPKHRAFSVCKDRLYGIGSIEERGQRLLMRNLLTHEVLWIYMQPVLSDGSRSGRPIPIIVDDEVYLSVGIDAFEVVDIQTGIVKWRGAGKSVRDPVLRVPQIEPCSFLVTLDKVVLLGFRSAEHGTVRSCSYERGTGRLVWQHDHLHSPGRTACVKDGIIFGTEIENPGSSQEVTHFCAWRVSDGELVWRLAYPEAGDIRNVIASEDWVVYINHYCQLFCFKTDIVV